MTANGNPDDGLDIYEICRKILEMLLAGKKPEEVQAELLGMGVPEDDAPQLINITVISAQAASPVLEQRSTPVAAVKSLVEQGMEERMATAMVSMILKVMGERAQNEVGARAEDAPALSEETMKVIVALAKAVAVDLQNGTAPETMAESIRNIDGIGQYPEIAGRELDFIEDVRLARLAAERARAVPLPQVLDELGLKQRPPHAAALAIVFMRLYAENQINPR